MIKPELPDQLLQWQQTMKAAAQLMRELHKKGFEVTLEKVEKEGLPYIKSKIIHRAVTKTTNKGQQ